MSHEQLTINNRLINYLNGFCFFLIAIFIGEGALLPLSIKLHMACVCRLRSVPGPKVEAGMGVLRINYWGWGVYGFLSTDEFPEILQFQVTPGHRRRARRA